MSTTSISPKSLNSIPLLDPSESESKSQQSNSLGTYTTCKTGNEMQKFHNTPSPTDMSTTSSLFSESAESTTPIAKQNIPRLDLSDFTKLNSDLLKLESTTVLGSELLKKLKNTLVAFSPSSFTANGHTNDTEQNNKFIKKAKLILHPDKYSSDEYSQDIRDSASSCFCKLLALHAKAIQEEVQHTEEPMPDGIFLHTKVPSEEIIRIYMNSYSPIATTCEPLSIDMMLNDYNMQNELHYWDTYKNNIHSEPFVKSLLDQNILTTTDINTFTEKQWQCFCIAASQANMMKNEPAHKSIFLGNDLNFQCFDHFLIHWAIQCHKPELLEKILNHTKAAVLIAGHKPSHGECGNGQDVGYVNCYTYNNEKHNFQSGKPVSSYEKYLTPLMRACAVNNKQCVEILLKFDADTTLETDMAEGGHKVQQCAIHYITGPDVIQSFINNNLDLNKQDSNGQTLLHILASQSTAFHKGSFIQHKQRKVNNEDLIINLLCSGAQISIKDNKGNMPIHIACQSGNHSFIFDLLLCPEVHQEVKAQAKLLKVTDEQTRLESSGRSLVLTKNNNTDITRLFLSSNKWMLDIRNEHGELPIHMAARSGNLDMLKLLAAANCNFDVRDSQGNSPLQSAIISMLLENIKEDAFESSFRLICWLMTTMLPDEEVQTTEVFQQILTEHMIGINLTSTVQVRKHLKTFFRKARGDDNIRSDTENSQTSFYQTKPNLFSVATEESIIAFSEIENPLHALINSAKSTAEKARLQKVLNAAPIGISAYKSSTLSIDFEIIPQITTGTSETSQAENASHILDSAADVSLGRSIKGFFGKNTPSFFDKNLAKVRKIPSDLVKKWIYQYNFRCANKPTQEMLMDAPKKPNTLMLIN